MPPDKSNRRLGRGLDALFNSVSGQQQAPDSPLRTIALSEIAPNPFQPRKDFSRAELRELEESLRTSGLLQAVTVRPAPGGKGYQLIAGERRLRAATNLGWKDISAVVRELDDREMLTLALVENLQRFDLNPIEEAEGYARLIKDFGYTQQSVAEMVGKDRSTVANVIRILQLPDDVRALVQEGKISSGQARPLLGIEDSSRLAALVTGILEHGWNARTVEAKAREETQPAQRKGRGRPRKEDSRPAELKSIEQRIRKHLQTDVTLNLKKENRGSLVIEFYSADDLERLMDAMGIPNNPQ
jgi:ParB family chromosome partitioning protein